MILSAFFDAIQSFVIDNGRKIIASICIILITIIIILLLLLLMKRHEQKNQTRKRKSNIIRDMFLSVVKYLLIFICLLLLLYIWEINLKPILIGVAIFVLAISFGAHKEIANIISGISMSFDSIYDIDDVVEIDGFKGVVIYIGLKTTKIKSSDNLIKTISNSSITSVINYSKAPSVLNIDVMISHEENLDKVFNILEEKIILLKDQFEQIVEGPNVIGVVGIEKEGVIIRIIVKTLSEQYYSVERASLKFIKELFDEEGIKIICIKNNLSNE